MIGQPLRVYQVNDSEFHCGRCGAVARKLGLLRHGADCPEREKSVVCCGAATPDLICYFCKKPVCKQCSFRRWLKGNRRRMCAECAKGGRHGSS
jgi:hypothetical protein